MSSEFEPTPRFVIDEMQPDEIDAATLMRMQSWIDTYSNPDLGITSEWIEERFAQQLLPESRQIRLERFSRNKAAGTFNAWAAHDEAGNIIGVTTPFITPEGKQKIGSIYVDKDWHGTGVGNQLMQKAVDWLDPTKPIYLGVATYNDRAKAFYRKWSFEEIPDSEELYDEKIPQIMMIRQPQNTQGETK